MAFNEHITEFNGRPVRIYQPGEPVPENPGAYAWKVSIDNMMDRVDDPYDKWESDFAARLREFVAQPWACDVGTFVVGANTDYCIPTDTAAIAAELAKLPLTALFCGDIERREALFNRTGVRDHRRRAIAGARQMLGAA